MRTVDVYKRQELPQAGIQRDGEASRCSTHPPPCGGCGQFILRDARPVSYTHLDVYKRQDDKSTWTEPKNPDFDHWEDEDAVRMILSEFGLDPESGHIINGHTPVKAKMCIRDSSASSWTARRAGANITSPPARTAAGSST